MDTINAKAINAKQKMELGTDGSAGYDLKINIDVVIPVGQTQLVGTGISVEIPKGFFGLVVPRSSTGKKGLILTNTVGIIDSDYRGEILCNIQNVGKGTYLGYTGDRLFQLVLIPCITPKVIYVNEFSTKTDRGDGGFGSTGA